MEMFECFILGDGDKYKNIKNKQLFIVKNIIHFTLPQAQVILMSDYYTDYWCCKNVTFTDTNQQKVRLIQLNLRTVNII